MNMYKYPLIAKHTSKLLHKIETDERNNPLYKNPPTTRDVTLPIFFTILFWLSILAGAQIETSHPLHFAAPHVHS